MATDESRIRIDADFYRHDFAADARTTGIDSVPTEFRGGVLEYANFSGLHLPGLVIDTADCAESRWDYATIDGATIQGDSSFMHTHMHDTSARNLTATGIDFAGTKAAGITLDGATFSRCGLNFLHASGGTAIGMTITGGTMVNSFWMNKDLTNTTFTSTNATSARFNRAHGTNVRFVDTNLSDTRWRGADVTGWDFTGSILTGADFTDAIGLTLEQLQATKDWDLAKGTILGIDALLEQERATTISSAPAGRSQRLMEIMDRARGARESVANSISGLRR